MNRSIFFGFVFACTVLTAQVRTGAPNSLDKSNVYEVAPGNNCSYVYRLSHGKDVLFRLDEEGKEKQHLCPDDQKLKYQNEKVKFSRLLFTQTGPLLIYNCTRKSDKSRLILAVKPDPVTLEIKDTLHLILHLQYSTAFTVTPSDDRTVFLFHTHYEKLVENKGRKICHNQICAINSELKILNAFQEALPSGKDESGFSWEDYAVDNKGNAAAVVLEEAVDHTYGTKFLMTVFGFNAETHTTTEFKPQFPDEIRVNPALELSFLDNGNYYLAGYYSEGNNGGAAGIYFVAPGINESKPVINAFSLDLIGENTCDKYKTWLQQAQQKNKAPGIPDLIFNKIINAKDGSVFLLAEQQLMQDYTFYHANANADATWSNLFINDLTKLNPRQCNVLITHLDSKGNLIRNTWVLKNQEETSYGKEFCSFIAKEEEGKIFLVFNDHPDNLNQDADLKFNAQSPLRDSLHVPVKVTVDRNGNVQRILLSKDPVLQNLHIEPDRIKLHPDKGMLLFSRDRNKMYRILKTE